LADKIDRLAIGPDGQAHLLLVWRLCHPNEAAAF
jgi:hypothetical protein